MTFALKTSTHATRRQASPTPEDVEAVDACLAIGRGRAPRLGRLLDDFALGLPGPAALTKGFLRLEPR